MIAMKPGSTSAKVLVRACPICACGNGRILHHQEFATLAELEAPDAYDVVACLTCGFVFADFFIDQVEIDRAYEERSKYAVNLIEDDAAHSAMPAPEPPFDLARMHDAAGYIARLVPDRSARVLDAGCATGALLGFLRDEGFANVVGLDPSPDAALVAKRAHGVDVIAGSFMYPPPSLGTFDLAILSHTLEHLPAVASAIARLRDLVVPGGFAYVEVPDATRYADYLVSPFHDFNTEHVNHFSLPLLRLAMERGGFEEVDTGSKLVECGPGIPYPAIYGLWRATGHAPVSEAPIEPDAVLFAATQRYVTASAALMTRMSDALAERIPAFQEIVVWGAGQLTMKLLCDTVLARRNVLAIVDASPQRQGLHVGSHPVVAPEALRAMPHVPIVIGSIHSEESIVAMIRKAGYSNDVICLRPGNRAGGRKVLHSLPIEGCYEVRALVHTDMRGSFAKMFEALEFADRNVTREFEEVFYTVSHANVLRGMHLQLPPAQHGKFLYCVAGSILDVALDLRAGDAYGSFCSLELSANLGNGVTLAPGVAHGFYVLEAPAIVVYHTTSRHEPALDTGIKWDSFGMHWPCQVPILSERDDKLPAFGEFVSPFGAAASSR